MTKLWVFLIGVWLVSLYGMAQYAAAPAVQCVSDAPGYLTAVYHPPATPAPWQAYPRGVGR